MDHAGKPWKLLEGASDLTLALRANAPMIMTGDLGEVAPSELLNFLQQGRRTGVLLSRADEVERALVMIDGDVARACSSSPAERLGEILAHTGLTDHQRVEEALAQQKGGAQKRIGQLLVDKGALAPDALFRGLRAQCVEIFLGFLVARSGAFAFLRGLDESKLPVRLELETQALLLDGLRRLDEMELYRTRVPSAEAVPHPTGKRLQEAMPAEAYQLLALVDGKRTMAELATITALGEFEATKAAYRLIEQGYLRL
jgi:hypothetical protein